MHEFSLAQGLMQQLLEIAAQHQAVKILKVKVTIGRLSGIVADSFSFGFETLAAERDLTKQAVLEITETDPAQRCLDCCNITDSPTQHCPKCNSLRLVPEGGDDLILTQVEME